MGGRAAVAAGLERSEKTFAGARNQDYSRSLFRRNAYRQGAIHRPKSVCHHERAVDQSPDSAARSESGHYSRAAGNYLSRSRTRSEKALCERARVRTGPGTSGKGGRRRPRRIAELETETLAGHAARSFLHHAGLDPRRRLRADALRCTSQMTTEKLA